MGGKWVNPALMKSIELWIFSVKEKKNPFSFSPFILQNKRLCLGANFEINQIHIVLYLNGLQCRVYNRICLVFVLSLNPLLLI